MLIHASKSKTKYWVIAAISARFPNMGILNFCESVSIKLPHASDIHNFEIIILEAVLQLPRNHQPDEENVQASF
jgi:hypothetical protein